MNKNLFLKHPIKKASFILNDIIFKKGILNTMKAVHYTALTLVIIGALNWLLVGLFEFNLVDSIFGESSILSRIIYILVGISGLWSIIFYKLINK